jgi:hypothetical protein
MMMPEDMNAGVQPLDALLDSSGFKNHDLVAAAPDLFLTHKEIAKARKGRRLTAHTQRRVLTALNACLKTRELPAVNMEAVFNYRGR